MALMGRKHRVQDVFARSVLELRIDLEAKFSCTAGTGFAFIHPNETELIITPKRIHNLFGNHSWYQNNHFELWEHMRLIICTLVVAGWDSWDHWEQSQGLFFRGSAKAKKPRLTDKDLPTTLSAFTQPPSHQLLGGFQRAQYVFAPVVIRQGSHCVYSEQHGLPILKAEDVDPQGAQGEVQKVTIEANFLDFGNQSCNSQPQVMAYKRFQANTDDGKHDFRTEQRALENCRVSLSQNPNIMSSFAPFLHGSHLGIITPWAHGKDLNRLLYNPESVLLDNHNKFSHCFSPDNLLTEAYSLARALHFLHFELLTPRGRSVRCAHLGRQPGNVLVEWLPGERDMPVGRWKICDFELSEVEETVTEDQSMPIGLDEHVASTAPGIIADDFSFQPRVRGPGPFQPPEVGYQRTPKVHTKRDVWSYGCILAMVLAFAFGGPQEVEAQKRRRAVGLDDCFYWRMGRRSRGDPLREAEIKPGIRK